MLHINEIPYSHSDTAGITKREGSKGGEGVQRDRKTDKEKGKAPSASSSSVYIHYPCYSGVRLAWLNYRYIIINHIALFIFIQHQSIYNPEGREAVGTVPGLCGVICRIIMHTAQWGTGAKLTWLFQLSPELSPGPDCPFWRCTSSQCKYNHWNIPTANTDTDTHPICKYCTLLIEFVVFYDTIVFSLSSSFHSALTLSCGKW